MSHLQQRLQETPDDALMQFGYGRECARAGQYEEAVSALRKAIRLLPDYPAAYRELGKSLMALDELKSAKHVFEEGISIAQRTGDIQAAKEMRTSLKRLEDRGDS